MVQTILHWITFMSLVIIHKEIQLGNADQDLLVDIGYALEKVDWDRATSSLLQHKEIQYDRLSSALLQHEEDQHDRPGDEQQRQQVDRCRHRMYFMTIFMTTSMNVHLGIKAIEHQILFNVISTCFLIWTLKQYLHICIPKYNSKNYKIWSIFILFFLWQ